MSNTYEWQSFPSFGFIMLDLNERDVAPIWQEVNKIRSGFAAAEKDTFTQNLVGNIKQEYMLKDCFNHVAELSLQAAELYDSHFDYSKSITVNSVDYPLILQSLWVNFQKKHEFNPPHIHNGVFSFVIWLQIPYESKDELNMFPNSRQPQASFFNFHYTHSTGIKGDMHIPVDKTYQNKMCIFPASMSHSVNPFYTSDDYRISVAGNLAFEPI